MPVFSTSRLQLYAIDAAMAVSLGLLVFGLSATQVLAPVGWTRTTTGPFLVIALACCAVVITSALLQHRTGVSKRMQLGAILGFVAISVFGFAAVAIVSALMAASLILGTWVIAATAGRDSGWSVAQRLSIGLGIFVVVLTIASPFRVNFAPAQFGLIVMAFIPLLKGDIRERLMVDFCVAVSVDERGEEVYRLTLNLLLVFIFVYYMFHAALPERYHDAAAVHIYVASHMAANGFWSFDPKLYVYAVMPLGIDFIFAFVYQFGGEAAVKLFNYITLGVTCLLIYGAAASRFGRTPALVAVLLFASMPLTLIETASAFIENPLTMWLTAAACVIFDRGRDVRLGDFLGILVLLTAATLSKVHGGIASALLGIVMVALYVSRHRDAGSLWKLCLAVAVAALLALMPYANAYRLTGNPLFPFFNNIFQSPFFDTARFVDERWVGRFDFQLLYRATFSSGSFLEAYNGALGFSLMAFLIAGLIAVFNDRSNLRLLTLYFGGFICAIGLATQYLRYFYPVLPVAALAIAYLASIYLSRRRLNVVFFSVALGIVLLNIYKSPSAGWILGDYDFRVLADKQLAQRFERAYLPEKALLRVVNNLAGRNSRVLLSGMSTAAPLEGVALYTSWYSSDFSRAGAGAKSAADIDAYLRLVRPTYILHRSPAEGPYAFHPLLDSEIQRIGRPVATLENVTLYEVRPF